MKQLILILFFTSLYLSCFSQSKIDSPKFSALSYELGKTGLVHNLYFDNKISNSFYGYRAGLGSNLGGYLYFGKLSFGVYKLFGKKNKFFELGIDMDFIGVARDSYDQIGLGNFVYPDYKTEVISPNLNIGYRSYSKKGRLFRIGISPFYIDKFLLGGYISFGLRQFQRNKKK